VCDNSKRSNNVYGAVIIAQALCGFVRCIWWM